MKLPFSVGIGRGLVLSIRLYPLQAMERFGCVSAGSGANQLSQTAYCVARKFDMGTSAGERKPMGGGSFTLLPADWKYASANPLIVKRVPVNPNWVFTRSLLCGRSCSRGPSLSSKG